MENKDQNKVEKGDSDNKKAQGTTSIETQLHTKFQDNYIFDTNISRSQDGSCMFSENNECNRKYNNLNHRQLSKLKDNFENGIAGHQHLIDIFKLRSDRSSFLDIEDSWNDLMDMKNNKLSLQTAPQSFNILLSPPHLDSKESFQSGIEEALKIHRKEFPPTTIDIIKESNIDKSEQSFDNRLECEIRNLNENGSFQVKQENQNGAQESLQIKTEHQQDLSLNETQTYKFSKDKLGASINGLDSEHQQSQIKPEIHSALLRKCSSEEDHYQFVCTGPVEANKKTLRQAMVESALRPKHKGSKQLTESVRLSKSQPKHEKIALKPSQYSTNHIHVKNNINQSNIEKKSSDLLGIILRVKAQAIRLAWKTEARRLAMLQKQNFRFLRDLGAKGGHTKGNKIVNNLTEGYDDNRTEMRRDSEEFGYFPVIAPQWRWKFLWDFIVTFAIASFFFFLPLRLVYQTPIFELYQINGLDFLFSIITSLDVLLSLNTAQYLKGKLVEERQQLLYLFINNPQGVLSLLGVISIWLCVLSDRLDFQLNNSILSFLTIIFMMKILTFESLQHSLADRFHFKRFSRGVVQLIQIAINLFIVTHIFASIWLQLGKYDQSIYQSDFMDCINQNNIQLSSTQKNDQCIFSWMDKFRYQDIISSEVTTIQMYDEYLRAYYFTTVTMITVGYGDFIPANSREYLLSILIMLIACGMFGYSLNSIGKILAEMDTHHRAFDVHFSSLNSYMHSKNIPFLIQHSVREYLQYFFIQSDFDDYSLQQQSIKLLPEMLQKQILTHANKIALYYSPIFKDNFSEGVVEKTVEMIEERKVRPGEIIIKQGVQDDSSIYFVESGSVELFNENSGERLNLMEKGASFGEIAFFTGLERSCSVRSVEFSSLLVVKRSDFLAMIKSYPQDLEKFAFIKDSICFRDKLEKVAVTCLCCRSTSHVVSKCDFVHLITDKQKAIDKYKLEENNDEREKQNRREDRINSRQCIQAIQTSAAVFIEDNIDLFDNDFFIHNDITKQVQEQFIRAQSLTKKRQALKNYYQREDGNQTERTQSETMIREKQVQFQKANQDENQVHIGFVNYASINSNLSPNHKQLSFQQQFQQHSVQFQQQQQQVQQQQLQQQQTNITNLTPLYPSNTNFLKKYSMKSEESNFHNHKDSPLLLQIQNKAQLSMNSVPFLDMEDQESKNNPQIQQILNINPSSNNISFNHNSEQVGYNNNTHSPTHRFSSFADNQSNNIAHNNNNNNNCFSEVSGGGSLTLIQKKNNMLNDNQYQVQGLNRSTSIALNSNAQINIVNNNVKALFQRQISTSLTSQTRFGNSQQQQQQIIYPQTQQPLAEHGRNMKTENQIQRGSKRKISNLQDYTKQNRTRNQARKTSYLPQQFQQQHQMSLNNINYIQQNSNNLNSNQNINLSTINQENIMKQLFELIQLPSTKLSLDDGLFESMKNFVIYLPHNNCERVINSFTVNQRKKAFTQSMKKLKNCNINPYLQGTVQNHSNNALSNLILRKSEGIIHQKIEYVKKEETDSEQ